jgi:hypothetical protein
MYFSGFPLGGYKSYKSSPIPIFSSWPGLTGSCGGAELGELVMAAAEKFPNRKFLRDGDSTAFSVTDNVGYVALRLRAPPDACLIGRDTRQFIYGLNAATPEGCSAALGER